MTKNFCTFAVQNPRKDAGVVDRDGLENRCTLTGTQGSNPCLSAKKQPLQAAFLHPERRDENPGRVRYRAALCEAETPCLSAKKQPLQAAFFCIRKDGMRTLEGSLPRSALRSRDSLSFPNQLNNQVFTESTPNITPGNGSNIGCFIIAK